MTNNKVCCICGSEKNVCMYKGSLYCKKHYNHMYRYGKIIERTIYDKNEYRIINNEVHIILRDRYQNVNGVCVIDKEDYKKVCDYKWYNSNGYAKTKGYIKNKTTPIQNIIMDIYNSNYIVDHIDRNKFNNTKQNLRVVNKQENSSNLSIKITNTSGVSGVRVYKNDSLLKWEAFIVCKYKRIYLGRSISFDEAVRLRVLGESNYFKELSPNYNKDTNTIKLEYISRDDNLITLIDVDLDGNVLQFKKLQ